MAEKQKRGLGRGLSALMADVGPVDAEPGENVQKVRKPETTMAIEMLEPNPEQPRKHFNRDDMQDLIASVKEKGILQPLIVRKTTSKTNSYQIVAGERRWRAAQQAQLHEVPVLVREYTDEEVLEIAIIENVQRSDLNAIDEALGYKQLMDRFGHTQDKLAQALSKSRSYIANLIRLLQLPDDVQELLRDGELSIGHARALITSDSPSVLAREVVRKGLSVRETEKLAKGPLPKKEKLRSAENSKDADTKALEGDLSATLGMKVAIDHKAGSEKGKVSIDYKTMEELDEICRILSTANKNVFS